MEFNTEQQAWHVLEGDEHNTVASLEESCICLLGPYCHNFESRSGAFVPFRAGLGLLSKDSVFLKEQKCFLLKEDIGSLGSAAQRGRIAIGDQCNMCTTTSYKRAAIK